MAELGAVPAAFGAAVTMATIEPRARSSIIARNALINLAGIVVPLLVAFLTLPLLINGLGTARFGVLSLVWLLLTYLSEVGFSTTATRYAAEAIGRGRTDELRGIMWTTAALQTVAGVVAALALVAATPWLVSSALKIPPALVGEARTCFYLVAAALPVLGWQRSFRGIVEAAQRFDLAFAVLLPITAGSYMLAALGARSGWSLPAVTLVIIGARLVALPAYYLAAHVALPGVSLRPQLRLHKAREIAAFTSWVAVSTLVSPLLLYIDRFMIGVLLSMSAVTFYAAPYEIVARLTLIPGAVLGALFPALSQLSGQAYRAEAEQLAVRCIKILVFVLAPILILIVGGAHDGLVLWLGADYARQSAVAMQILAIGVVVNAAAHVPYALLHSTGRPDIPARFHLIELPLQILLAWLLITRWGISGAAMAWTARMTIDAVLLFGAAARLGLLRGSVLVAQLRMIVIAVAVIGIATAALAGSVTSAGGRVLLTIGLAVFCALLLWARGITTAERGRIIALFRLSA